MKQAIEGNDRIVEKILMKNYILCSTCKSFVEGKEFIIPLGSHYWPIPIVRNVITRFLWL